MNKTLNSKQYVPILVTGFLAVMFIASMVLDLNSQTFLVKGKVATVGRVPITKDHLTYSYRKLAQIVMTQNPQITPESFNTILEKDLWSFIQSRYAMTSLMKQFHYRVPKEEVKNILKRTESFLDEDGVIQESKIKHYLSKMKYAFKDFYEDIEQQILYDQLYQTLADSTQWTQAENEQFLKIASNQKSVIYRTFKVNQFDPISQPTHQAIQTFYSENKTQFVIPELYQFVYTKIKPKINYKQTVSQKALREFYNQHLDQYQVPPKVKLRKLHVYPSKSQMNQHDLTAIASTNQDIKNHLLEQIVSVNGRGFKLDTTQNWYTEHDLPYQMSIEQFNSHQKHTIAIAPEEVIIFEKIDEASAFQQDFNQIQSKVRHDFLETQEMVLFQEHFDHDFEQLQYDEISMSQFANAFHASVTKTGFIDQNGFTLIDPTMKPKLDQLFMKVIQSDEPIVIPMGHNEMLIVKLNDKKSEHLLSFDEAKDKIRKQLIASSRFNSAMMSAKIAKEKLVRKQPMGEHWQRKEINVLDPIASFEWLPLGLSLSKNEVFVSPTNENKEILVLQVVNEHQKTISQHSSSFIHLAKTWSNYDAAKLLSNLVLEQKLTRYDQQ